LFVWAAVEALPAGLDGATEVQCLMPWGSLLRAIVRPDEDVLRGVAAVCRPRAAFLITLNLHAWRPAVTEVGGTPEPTPESAVHDLAPAYARAGWLLEVADYLSEPELAALGTSWTKRLGSTRSELAVLALRGRINAAEGQDGY
jgi:16S rRNA (adenine(1408)-N(1))-methyltransferase